jgi:arginine N-succinyltransferase
VSSTDNLLIRAARTDDLEQLLQLSKLTGSGMTSMPTDRQSWIDKLARSTLDFSLDQPSMNGDVYFLVLEDLNTKELVGSGAFYSCIGLTQPFYSYKVTTLTTYSNKLDRGFKTRILSLVNDYTGATEVGSLFLKPEYRRDGIGKFLSRARFLLLADFPERFGDLIFAELRGWIDEESGSPFWEHLGRKFFGLSFQKADFISAVDGTQFISDLMPKHPVYLDLLPQEAQDVVGKPHDSGTGAVRILEGQGFKWRNYIDVFDAGPTLDANLNDIKTVKQSQQYTLSHHVDHLDSDDLYIISNCQLKNYSMTRAPLAITEDNQIALLPSDAEKLNLKVGDKLRIVKI